MFTSVRWLNTVGVQSRSIRISWNGFVCNVRNHSFVVLRQKNALISQFVTFTKSFQCFFFYKCTSILHLSLPHLYRISFSHPLFTRTIRLSEPLQNLPIHPPTHGSPHTVSGPHLALSHSGKKSELFYMCGRDRARPALHYSKLFSFKQDSFS